jgi:hypothetical protein
MQIIVVNYQLIKDILFQRQSKGQSLTSISRVTYHLMSGEVTFESAAVAHSVKVNRNHTLRKISRQESRVAVDSRSRNAGDEPCADAAALRRTLGVRKRQAAVFAASHPIFIKVMLRHFSLSMQSVLQSALDHIWRELHRVFRVSIALGQQMSLLLRGMTKSNQIKSNQTSVNPLIISSSPIALKTQRVD